jgi:hypothetical protein
VEKYKDFSGWSHCNGLPKYKNFSRDDMIGLEGALFKRWKLKQNEGSQTRSKGNEGSRAHLKGGRIRKRTTLIGRGLEGALERGEGSKAHSKGDGVRKHTTLNGRGLEGALS